ncbi:4'-phosphopantetheinyl transferase family protein [Methanobrevibacter sp.]|uniref:4'-phosphopantetheinyl transferase family protein n=1 Tax=Methanobrevibacter sp. TaxID=66852 RepID=UPI00386DA053
MKMIKLAYCNVVDLDLKKSYGLLPNDRKNKVDRFRFPKDKKLSCGAYLLLKKMLSDEDIYDLSFKYGKYEKAYLANHDNIYFNISHSGEYVACGISNEEIGVDVEQIDETIDLNIAKNYFFNEEYKDIITSKNPHIEFFNYWVLKESYMKYTGLGFNLNLDEFCILKSDEIKLKNDENNVKFSLFDIENYKLACAGKYKLKKCEEYFLKDLY